MTPTYTIFRYDPALSHLLTACNNKISLSRFSNWETSSKCNTQMDVWRDMANSSVLNQNLYASRLANIC